MRILLAIALTLVAVMASAAGTQHKKLPNESDIAFVERATGLKVVPGQLARTKTLIPGKDAIVAFTQAAESSDPERDGSIFLNVLAPLEGDEYARNFWGACDVEGGDPTLRSFFYAHADASKDLAVGVICGWDATHVGADCAMNDAVKFFKIPADLLKNEISEIQDKKFTAFYREEKRAGETFTCTKSNFKSAKDVKAILAKLGYK